MSENDEQPQFSSTNYATKANKDLIEKVKKFLI